MALCHGQHTLRESERERGTGKARRKNCLKGSLGECSWPSYSAPIRIPADDEPGSHQGGYKTLRHTSQGLSSQFMALVSRPFPRPVHNAKLMRGTGTAPLDSFLARLFWVARMV